MAETGCPSAHVLLCASTGELPPREGREVVAHLCRCAACRDEFGRLIRTFMMVAGRDEFYSPVSASATARFVSRLHAQKQASLPVTSATRAKQWLPAAAVIFVVFMGAMLTRGTVVVQADQVLRQALLRERSYLPVHDAWLQIDVKPIIVNGRPRVRTVSALRPVSELRLAGAPPELRQVLPHDVASALDEYRVDWEAPLDVHTFQAWRARLGERHDAVTRGRRDIVLRTSTPIGAVLREVELVLDRESYQVVRIAWTVAEIGRLEIARSAAPPHATTSVATRAANNGHGEAAALMDAELDARLVLRRTGLDLKGTGVANTGASVLVTGVTPSRAQQRSLAASLGAIPSVELRLAPHRSAPRTTDVVVGPKISAWTNRMFGETKEGREFVPTLRTLAARVHERVRILNGLDERYSRADVEHLPPQVRAKLQHLLNLHFAALNDDLIELDGRLSLLAGTSAARRAVSLKAAPNDWRRRVQATRPAANVLGASIEPLVTLDAPGQLGTTAFLSLRRVWESINGNTDVHALPSPPQ